jgi:anti-sigma B factor antagonist
MRRRAPRSVWTGAWRATFVALAVALPAVAVVGWGSPTNPSWITAVALAVAVLALGRMGRGTFPGRLDGPVSTTMVDGAGARSETAAPAAPRPTPPPAREGERVLEALRAGMDEVQYAPGSPNVLSMTKWLDRAGEGVDDGASASGTGLLLSRADRGDETVLSVAGALDASTAADLRPAVDALVSEGRARVTLDLSSLRFLDGSGAASLVRLGRRCHELGGAVRVAGAKDQPLAVLKVLKLDRLLELA